MSDINTGGPAFPSAQLDTTTLTYKYVEGMTLRQYAAIKLKVPDSGSDWLDEMITKSLQNDFAAKAMQGLMVRNWSNYKGTNEELIGVWARSSYTVADAMLEAREA